jgi:hypothetical protein
MTHDETESVWYSTDANGNPVPQSYLLRFIIIENTANSQKSRRPSSPSGVTIHAEYCEAYSGDIFNKYLKLETAGYVNQICISPDYDTF